MSSPDGAQRNPGPVFHPVSHLPRITPMVGFAPTIGSIRATRAYFPRRFTSRTAPRAALVVSAA